MLLDLATLRLYLGETSTANDGLIRDLAEEAEVLIESYIGYPLSVTDKTEIRDGKGEQILTLRSANLNSLTSYEYNTGDIDSPIWEDLDPEAYRVDLKKGQILHIGSVPKWLANIKIVYSVGYTEDNIPKDLKLATKRLIAYLWRSRSTAGIRSESIDGSSVTYQDQSTTNGLDTQILDKYRTFNV